MLIFEEREYLKNEWELNSSIKALLWLPTLFQAWTWQDEWHGLTMEDIRAIEKETQDLLKKKMANPDACSEDGEYKPGYDLETDLDVSSNNAKAQFCSIEYSDADVPNIIPKTSEPVKRKSLGNYCNQYFCFLNVKCEFWNHWIDLWMYGSVIRNLIWDFGP